MSDYFKYDVAIHPSPTPIEVAVDVTADALGLTVTSVPDVGFGLTPTGNAPQKILAEILYPVATLVAGFAGKEPRSLLQGQSMSLGTIPPYTADGVTVTPSGVALGAADIGDQSFVKVTATLSAAAVGPTQSES